MCESSKQTSIVRLRDRLWKSMWGTSSMSALFGSWGLARTMAEWVVYNKQSVRYIIKTERSLIYC